MAYPWLRSPKESPSFTNWMGRGWAQENESCFLAYKILNKDEKVLIEMVVVDQNPQPSVLSWVLQQVYSRTKSFSDRNCFIVTLDKDQRQGTLIDRIFDENGEELRESPIRQDSKSVTHWLLQQVYSELRQDYPCDEFIIFLERGLKTYDPDDPVWA